MGNNYSNDNNKAIYIHNTDLKTIKHFKQEISVINSLHFNVIQQYQINYNQINKIIIKQTQLAYSLDQIINQNISHIQLKEIFKQICFIVNIFHSITIIHGNLKPSNILFNNENEMIISDYLLNEIRSTDQIPLSSYQYFSPEQLKGKEIDIESDIWGLGCILYKLLTKHDLFKINNKNEIKLLIDNLNLPNFTEIINPLLTTILKIDPKERISSNELLLTLYTINNDYKYSKMMKRALRKKSSDLYYNNYWGIDMKTKYFIDFRIGRKQGFALKTIFAEGQVDLYTPHFYPHIGDNGLNYLCHTLPKYSNICGLELCDDNITDMGVKSLCNNIHYLSKVMYLSLSRNKITDEGVKSLSENLSTLHNLEELSLTENKITSKGVMYLVSQCESCANLKCIALRGNLFSEGKCIEEISFTIPPEKTCILNFTHDMFRF